MSTKPRHSSGVRIFQRSLSALKKTDKNVLRKDTEESTEAYVDSALNVTSMNRKQFWNPPRRGHGKHGYAMNRRCKTGHATVQELGDGDTGANSQHFISKTFTRQNRQIAISPGNKDLEKEHSIEEDWSDDLIDIHVNNDLEHVEINCDHNSERRNTDNDMGEGLNRGSGEDINADGKLNKCFPVISEHEPISSGLSQSIPTKHKSNTATRCKAFNNKEKLHQLEETSEKVDLESEAKNQSVNIQESEDCCKDMLKYSEPKDYKTPTIRDNDSSLQTADNRSKTAYSKTCVAEKAAVRTLSPRKADHGCVDGKDSTSVCKQVEHIDDKSELGNTDNQSLSEVSNVGTNFTKQAIKRQLDKKKCCFTIGKTDHRRYEMRPIPPRFQTLSNRGKYAVPNIHSTPKYKGPYTFKSYRGRRERWAGVFRERNRYFVRDGPQHYTESDSRSLRNVSSEDWESEIDHKDIELSKDLDMPETESETEAEPHCRKSDTLKETPLKQTQQETVASKGQIGTPWQCWIITKPYLPPPPPSDDEEDISLELAALGLADEMRAEVYTPETGLETSSKSAHVSMKGVKKSFKELSTEHIDELGFEFQTSVKQDEIHRESEHTSMCDTNKENSCDHSNVEDTVDCDYQAAVVPSEQFINSESFYDANTDHCADTVCPDIYNTDFSDIAVISQDECTNRKKKSTLSCTKRVAVSDIPNIHHSQSDIPGGHDHQPSHQYTDPWFPYNSTNDYRDMYHRNMWANYEWYNYHYGGFGAYNHYPYLAAPYSNPPSHMWERPGFGYPLLPEFPMGRSLYPGMIDSCRDGVLHRIDTGGDTVKSQLPMQENWKNKAMVQSKETSLRKSFQDKVDHLQPQANHDSTNHDQIPNKGSNFPEINQSSNVKAGEKVKHAKRGPNSHHPRSDTSSDNNDQGRQRKATHCCCKPEQVQYLLWRACRCPEGIPPRLQKIYNSGQDEPSLDLGYQSYDSIEESGPSRCPLKSVMSEKVIMEEPFPLPSIQPHTYMLTTDSRSSDHVVQNQSSTISSPMQQGSSQRRQMDNILPSTQRPADFGDNKPPSRKILEVAGNPDSWDINNNNMTKCTGDIGDRNLCNKKPAEHMDNFSLYNAQAQQEELGQLSQSPSSEVAYMEMPTDLTKSASHLASASASLTRAGQTDTNLNSALNTFSEAIIAIGKTLQASKECINVQETNTDETYTMRDKNVSKPGRMANLDDRNTAKPDSHVKSESELRRKVCLTNMAGKTHGVEYRDPSVDLKFVEDSSVCEADIDSDASGDNRIIQHTMTQSSGSGLEAEDMPIDKDTLQPCERNRNLHEVNFREYTKESFPRSFDHTQKTPDQPSEMRRHFIPSEYRPRSHFLSSPPVQRLSTSPRQEHCMPRHLYGGSPGWLSTRPQPPPCFQSNMDYPRYQAAMSSADMDFCNQYPYEQNSSQFEWRMNSWLKGTESKRKHVEPNQTFSSIQSATLTQSNLSMVSAPNLRSDLHKVKHEAKMTSKVVEYSSSEESYGMSDSDEVTYDSNDDRTTKNYNSTVGKHVAKKLRSQSSDCSDREFSEESLEENSKVKAKNVLEKTISSSLYRNRPKRLPQKVLKSFMAPDVPTSKVHSPGTSKYGMESISANRNECKHEMHTPPLSVLTPGPPGARSMPPLPPFPASPFWGMYLPSNTSALSGQSPKEKSYSAALQTGVDNRFSSPQVNKPAANRKYMRRSWPVSGHYARSTSESDSEVHSPCLWDWKKSFREFHNFGVKYIDTHCHLDYLFNREGFWGNLQSYMAKHPESFPDMFEGCVAVFCNPSSFNPNNGLWLEVAKESNVWIAMGCHPKSALDFTEAAENSLRQCLKHSKCIALGEIGLDYSGTFWQHTDVQKEVLRKQLEMALEMNKPLVIHCREAEDDCLSILKEMVPKDYKIHCHCFTAAYNNAKLWTDAFPNLYIGITPLVTYSTASSCHNLARNIPLNRLLLETDAPYFVPRCIPKKDMTLSNPGLAVTVAKEVAKYQELPVAAVLRQCRLNTKFMYGI